MLIDCYLDIPFRADIAVLTRDATERLQELHFETGNEDIRQGEAGDTAYLNQSSQRELFRNGPKVGEVDGRLFQGNRPGPEYRVLGDGQMHDTLRIDHADPRGRQEPLDRIARHGLCDPQQGSKNASGPTSQCDSRARKSRPPRRSPTIKQDKVEA